MTTPLRHALLDHPETAYRVAIKMDISEVRLSKIASGLINPNDNEKKQLSAILGRPVNELFLGGINDEKQ
tara:strand:- start:5100 stop:5309 length:210 start_codon:yes stop_codon:yes gene_type:complete